VFVDLHSHILPGVDDGAQTVEDAVYMARSAVAEGISYMLCTPHYNNGHYMNKKTDIIRDVASLQTVFNQLEIPLTLFEGQEVRISEDLSRRIVLDEILFADLSDTYIMIELPFTSIPEYTYAVLSDLCSKGYRPIIVHPERNSIFMENPKRLEPFIEMGCLSQITNGSYIGQFGKKAQKASEIMIKHNYAQILSSDAHNVSTRGFYTTEAYDLLEEQFGVEKRQAFEQITKDIVNGDQVEIPSIVEVKKKHWVFF